MCIASVAVRLAGALLTGMMLLRTRSLDDLIHGVATTS
jgi:hypothetical protein